MNKFKLKIIKILAGLKLKWFGKKVICLESDKYTKFLEPGSKTRARFNMISVAYTALEYVYGNESGVLSSISGIKIDEDEKLIRVSIHTFKPGLLIGKRGVLFDKFKHTLQDTYDKDVDLNIYEEKGRNFYGVSYVNLY